MCQEDGVGRAAFKYLMASTLLAYVQFLYLVPSSLLFYVGLCLALDAISAYLILVIFKRGFRILPRVLFVTSSRSSLLRVRSNVWGLSNAVVILHVRRRYTVSGWNFSP